MPTVTYDFRNWEGCTRLAFKYLKNLEVYKNKKIPYDIHDLYVKYVYLFLKEGHVFENKWFKKWIRNLKPDMEERIKLVDTFEAFFKIVMETPEERQERLKLIARQELEMQSPWKGKSEDEVRSLLLEARKQKLEMLDDER